MKLPLLISAHPKLVGKFSHPVSLPRGNWRFLTDGIKDTIAFIRTGFGDFSLEEILVLEEHTKVFVVIDRPGSESKIYIAAEKI